MKAINTFEDYENGHYQDATNTGCIFTYVLAFQALHDDLEAFGSTRLNRLTTQIAEYILENFNRTTTVRDVYDELVDAGLNSHWFDFFQRKLMRVAVNEYNRKSKKTISKAIYYTYVGIFKALRKYYKFGKVRMQRIQKRMNEYVSSMLDGTVTLIEYMKCLSDECGIPFETLKAYEKENGVLKIYG